MEICVDSSGSVSNARVVKHSIPVVDNQLPGVIGHWKYHPFVRDGVPTPICYRMSYIVE